MRTHVRVGMPDETVSQAISLTHPYELRIVADIETVLSWKTYLSRTQSQLRWSAY